VLYLLFLLAYAFTVPITFLTPCLYLLLYSIARTCSTGPSSTPIQNLNLAST
jgi:hypothetical protein